MNYLFRFVLGEQELTHLLHINLEVIFASDKKSYKVFFSNLKMLCWLWYIKT